MKILLISDVHGNIELMDKIIKDNEKCDLKFFMGDFDLGEPSKQKEQVKKFDKVIMGNCDAANISPTEEIFEVSNLKIMMLHGHTIDHILNKKSFKKMFKIAKDNNVRLILHGHDHIDANEKKGNITRFNPGSITLPKGENGPSYGILDIDKLGNFTVKHTYL